MSNLMIFLINVYQKIPGNFHKCCRFTPTCSEYAKEAYKKYGFLIGTKLTIKRILRCNPFGKFGYDPVPNDYKEEKMKKKFKIGLLVIFTLICTGCDTELFVKDTMNDINIYTSIYPIEYVTKKIYGNTSKINNMYPAGINPYEYKFTKKQINDFSKTDLIIYNGLTNERDNVVDMLNNNKNLKIIDATARIEYSNDIDEIWMNPSNILTISQNIKTGLKEYINSKYLKNEIDNNYDKLKLELSRLDADIKDDITNAPYKQIVATNDSFKTFEKYGLTVYSLDNDSVTDKIYSDVIKLITNGEIKYIYTSSITKENKYLKQIKENYPTIEIIEINTLNNLSDEDKKNNKDYLTIMNENRDKLKKELYK